MLGYEIYIDPKLDVPSEEKPNPSLAYWRTSIGGLKWINDLVQSGYAIDLGGNGYPELFEASTKIIFPIILSGTPSNKSPIVIGDDYILPENWSEKITLYQKKIDRCSANDILVIEA